MVNYVAESSAVAEAALTEPQRRMLATVRASEAGYKVYNARARRTIEALEEAGLVAADWDMDITARGSTRWRITVTPKPRWGSQEDYLTALDGLSVELWEHLKQRVRSMMLAQREDPSNLHLFAMRCAQVAYGLNSRAEKGFEDAVVLFGREDGDQA